MVDKSLAKVFFSYVRNKENNIGTYINDGFVTFTTAGVGTSVISVDSLFYGSDKILSAAAGLSTENKLFLAN